MPKFKSEVVSGIDRIQASVVPLMKAAGFRKRGRAFNRSVADGLVHVVTFQAGEYMRLSYGTFTVNLGVFIPEVFALEYDNSRPKFLHEYDCEIREQLSELAAKNGDWWSATDDVETTATEFPHLIQEFALPFLARFTSHHDVLAEWESSGELPFHGPGRSSLAAAAILHAQGKTTDARAALQNAIAMSPDHKGFQEYVRSVAAKLSVAI